MMCHNQDALYNEQLRKVQHTTKTDYDGIGCNIDVCDHFVDAIIYFSLILLDLISNGR